MEYIRTDKNGTKYYADYTCQRCGGAGGSDKWQFTGWTCYECGGSGKSAKPEIIKEYTPEYEAKLAERRAKRAAKRLAEAESKAEETRVAWLEKNQFDTDGNTFVFVGDTYAIKDELKALGAKYDCSMGWHINKPVDGYEMKKLNINDIATATLYGYTIDYVKVDAQLAPPQEEQKESSYFGNVGDKVDLIVTLDFIAYWESIYGTTYVYNFVDADGNVFVWKTSKGTAIENKKQVALKGTIKEHSEYKGVKQTTLTRCKVTAIA